MNNKHHGLGTWSLTFVGLSAMLGSGWLLAAYYVYQQAGNYAPLSWVLGFMMVLVIALSFAETCSIVNKDGSTVLLPRISHGYMTSMIFGVFGLVSWVALIPIEVSATLQYLSYFINGIYKTTNSLSYFGTFLAIALVLAISMINTFSMLWIKRMNNVFFTPLKIGIPIIVIGYSLVHAYISHPVIPHVSTSVLGIFSALPVGVVFSFNAFKTICVIAGRAHSPKKTIIRSLILSLAICLFLYLGLQYALNLNATKDVLLSHQSPYTLILRDSTIMLVLLYIGATSSPFSANVFNLNAANACCYRMSSLGYIPSFFKKLNKYNQYIFANLLNSTLAVLLILNSGAWDTMVQNLTCVMIITYSAAPIALVVFRKKLSTISRGVCLPAPTTIGFFGFLFSTYMVYWTGYSAIKLSVLLLISLIVYGCIYAVIFNKTKVISLLRSIWMVLWLGIILLVSWLVEQHQLTNSGALILLSIFAVICFYIIIKSSLPENEALDIYNKLDKLDEY